MKGWERRAPRGRLTAAVCRALRIGCLLAAVALPAAAAVAADTSAEKILSFHADITILGDASLEVRETIQVLAACERIRRGIFRDFPTVYEGPDGGIAEVGFSVTEVLRDGVPEPWQTEGLDDGVRVRVGKRDVLLGPGVHTYTIAYRTTEQLGFFDDHDELYWNVTGNGWEFSIDLASATVRLPQGIAPGELALEGYTGAAGEKGRDYQASVGPDGTADFVCVRPLSPGEGLTIVVSFPKGHVLPPPPPSPIERVAARMKGAGAGAVGLLILLIYYLFAWVRVGRDPGRGPLVPLYEPPAGLSPAAARNLRRMGFDTKAFATAVIAMAVKGYLRIDDAEGTYTLSRENGSAPLAPEEKAAADKLFSAGESVSLVRTNHARVGGALAALRSSLRLRLEKVHFVTNRRYLVPGILISLLALAAAIATLPGALMAGAAFMTFWLSFWSIGVALLLASVWGLWRGVFSGRRGPAGGVAQAVIMTLFAVPFVAGEVFGIVFLGAAGSPAVVVLLLALVGANVLFHRLLAAPTRAGRALMDRIEGFREFLSAVEGDRLDTLYPAGRTPELFERYLPWALALDVEQQWAERFAGVLTSAGEGTAGYSPSWYRGGSPAGFGTADFASSLGGSLVSAVASSATAPGSSSGSGGGGSSGGGGGGGGGGGW